MWEYDNYEDETPDLNYTCNFCGFSGVGYDYCENCGAPLFYDEDDGYND